ncbi:hypothetical protein BDQ17DRAFT_1324229 [Cyathus striatus]|nr:hypothetical protein BDQ17DRAFT_1324229 [Cyathus striatus]
MPPVRSKGNCSDQTDSPEPVVYTRKFPRHSVYVSIETRRKPTTTITVAGAVLRPTIVFDTFWKYAAERKAMDDRRRNGDPAPWTTDQLLQQYHFCNTFRVLDKGCQYLIREVIEKGPQDPVEVVFRITLFNTFTKIETYEVLQSALAPLTWKSFNREKYKKVLAKHESEGNTLRTGSFFKPIPRLGHKEGYMNQLGLVECLMNNNLPERLQKAKYMAEVYEFLASFPGMGEFTTYQLLVNLSYSNVLNFHPNDFVIAGLGALSGLKKMFGASLAQAKKQVPDIEVQIMRWLTEHQNQQFRRLGLTFSGLGPNKLPMDVSDIEHTLCEVDKYSRLRHPQIKGTGGDNGRTHIRKKYTPSQTPLPRQPTLPAAWSHPRRKVPRIRSQSKLVVEKQYAIRCIKAHRECQDGIKYHVFWEGYPDSKATWEPERLLKEDAPASLQEYLDSLPKAKHPTAR